jgi:hypothetical protein
MENEMNEKLDPAAPAVESDHIGTPETPEISKTYLFDQTADLNALTDEERDLFNDFSDMTEAGIAMLPPDIRADLRTLQNKLAGKDTADETPAAAEPEEDAPAPEIEPEQPADDPAPATEPEAGEKPNYDEIIAELTEANRLLTARYNTLQGKYNAEVKKVNKSNPPPQKAPESDPESSGDTPSVPDQADRTAALAEKYGLDPDVIAAVRGIITDEYGMRNNGKENDDIAEKVEVLSAHHENALLDAAIREECEGLGLDEVGTHPLFQYYAQSRLFDDSGNSAWDAIAAAKERHDHTAAAKVIGQVVRTIKKNGTWDMTGFVRHSATAEPPAAPAAAPDAATTTTIQKPSLATPHSVSGVVNHTPHTGRTEKEIMAEYAALDAKRRKGDLSVIPRMEKLDAELDRIQFKPRT